MTDHQPSTVDNLQYWRNLNDQAADGGMHVPASIASACDAACETYLAHLGQMVNDAKLVKNLKGFGDMQSGQDLAAKFSRIAAGTPHSLDAILLQHIDIVQSMREFFRRYFDDHTSIDDQTATKISALSPEN